MEPKYGETVCCVSCLFGGQENHLFMKKETETKRKKRERCLYVSIERVMMFECFYRASDDV